jgi:hypothetical protein
MTRTPWCVHLPYNRETKLRKHPDQKSQICNLKTCGWVPVGLSSPLSPCLCLRASWPAFLSASDISMSVFVSVSVSVRAAVCMLVSLSLFPSLPLPLSPSSPLSLFAFCDLLSELSLAIHVCESRLHSPEACNNQYRIHERRSLCGPRRCNRLGRRYA